MEDPVRRALRHVRRRSSGGPVPAGLAVTVNFHPDLRVRGATVIEALAQDGTYRSQFETGVGNGGLTAHPGGDRWRWERRMFGGAYDAADPALRPKYGALNHRGDPAGGSPRFGSCHLRLRPHVLERTTFCYPDSHLDPGAFGVADRMALVDLATGDPFDLDPVLDGYVEAHVHGPLRVAEDADAVVLDPSYRGTTVEEAAWSLECAVEWHGGFRLPLDRLAECEAFRGPATARALATLARDGAVTPRDLGEARDVALDYQIAKWAWHCLVKFGRDR